MNRFFTKGINAFLLSTAAMFSTFVQAQDFAIVNLSPDEMSIEALNTTYTSGTSSVQVATGNMSFDATYTTNCVSFADQTGALYFDQITAPNYSFITIDNLGTDNITAIKLIGSSTSSTVATEVVVAFSSKSVSETDDRTYSENLDWVNPGVFFYSPAVGGGCQEHTVTLPDPGNTTSGDVISFVGSVKIAVTNSMEDYEYSLQKPFKLESITIYTDKQTDTGIGHVSGDSFGAYMSGTELNLTEVASSVFVYNISGSIVASAKNVQTLSLNALPAGMYVVKMINNTGKTSVIKIAR
jgi:hypothetical protein